ncbi:MAG TPA: hypothetical protein VG889_20270 [Rhizomicrobium sp.]|nr:hypothetical protein [Rhizomicrobium sp.]
MAVFIALVASSGARAAAQTIDSWGVQVIFPKMRFNQFANWLVGFAVDQADGPQGAGPVLMKGLQWLYGGTPVAGTLTLKTDGVYFEGDSLEAFFYFDNKPAKIFIPLREIRAARADPSFMGFSAYVFTLPRAYIETTRGEVAAISQFSSKSIAQEINDLLQRGK